MKIKDIDWEKVQEGVKKGINYNDIGPYVGVSREKFHKAFQNKYGCTYGEYVEIHRPKNYKIKIDWELVRKRYIQGCSSVEIARELGFNSTEGLAKRCKSELGMHLTEIRAQCTSLGDNTLRAAQYHKAVVDKDTSMLIFLGKNRLKQSERAQEKTEGQQKLKAFLKFLEHAKPDVFDQYSDESEDDEDRLCDDED